MARIDAGEFQPGHKIPPEEDLAASYGVARGTVRRATRQLEYAGILDVRHGHGTFVRLQREPDVVPLVHGQRVLARMPTVEEQHELDVRETTPVLVVLDASGNGMAYAADRVMLQCP
jgi:DNA-binding GntR family transcriptional regulator